MPRSKKEVEEGGKLLSQSIIQKAEKIIHRIKHVRAE
jgi:hypothetical protein